MFQRMQSSICVLLRYAELYVAPAAGTRSCVPALGWDVMLAVLWLGFAAAGEQLLPSHLVFWARVGKLPIFTAHLELPADLDLTRRIAVREPHAPLAHALSQPAVCPVHQRVVSERLEQREY